LSAPRPLPVQASFENVGKYWINEVRTYAEQDIEIMIAGCKSDKDDAREVPLELGEVLILANPKMTRFRRLLTKKRHYLLKQVQKPGRGSRGCLSCWRKRCF
jgi:GTPase SAR1 family protein